MDSDTFLRLGKGFARAIPQQLLALPGGLLVFNTSEFGYKTDLLNDLHLLDLNSGQLTTLLPAGQGGPAQPCDGWRFGVMVDSPQGWYAGIGCHHAKAHAVITPTTHTGAFSRTHGNPGPARAAGLRHPRYN